jgi:hypothetical protein
LVFTPVNYTNPAKVKGINVLFMKILRNPPCLDLQAGEKGRKPPVAVQNNHKARQLDAPGER